MPVSETSRRTQLGDCLAAGIKNPTPSGRWRASGLLPFLDPMPKQIHHFPGGIAVFAVKGDVVDTDPEGQQHGHNPKHSSTVAAIT